jgi:type I restriction enzyme, R subunit
MAEFRPLELNFENHFCSRLESHGYRKRNNGDFDLEDYLDLKLLEEFLETTQKEEFKEVKDEYGERWKKEFVQRFRTSLEKKKLFEVLKDGIEISNQKLKLIFFKPETSFNKEQVRKYSSNIFSYVRQFRFAEGEDYSIDIVLFLNGFPITTIELKSQMNEQIAEDAVSQYVSRDKKYKIFRTPFLHIATDTSKAKIASEFIQNSADDFAWFNKELENEIVDNEFRTEYLYNEILTPESLIEIIEHYLFCSEIELNGIKIRTFFFPRYHQRRTVLNLVEDIRNKFKKTNKLDLKYLIQHSAGSGKSYTIAVIQKFLRYLHVSNESVFDSIIILTDRINLDGQIRGTIKSGENQSGIVAYVEDTSQLARALNENKQVIITTIQKFSVKKLDELLKKQKRRICVVIDEAHRSQAGKLHKNMVGKLEPTEMSLDEEISAELSKKKFPNICFIALTATPSDKTIQTFSKPFDVYSMEQAEKEGYILPVSQNIVTYQTFYQLSSKINTNNEYPPLLVIKKLKNKAFEDEKIIKNKIDIILSIFKDKTENSIKIGKAKAMIVTSSRKAAVIYKKLLDAELVKRKLNHKTLVAFTGSVPIKENGEDKSYTESSMNGRIDNKIEDEFKKKDYRFIIVANKFQTGFNQPLLQTMFLDKSLSGINAVQTISRLNRTFPSKMNTLVIDFTNSYKEIIKAFKRFKDGVEDFNDIDISDLPRLQKKVLDYNIFTNKDIEEFKDAFSNANQKIIDNIFSRVEESLNKKYKEGEKRLIRKKLNQFSKLFSYLDNLIRIEDPTTRNLYRFVYYLSRYLNPLGTGKKIDEELKKVFLIRHKIKEVKPKESLLDTIIKKISSKKELTYATVQQVIEAINLQYKTSLTEGEENAIKSYMEEIGRDPEILQDIRANLDKDLDRFFEISMRDKLYERFMDYFMHYNIDKVSYYIEKGLESFINKSVFAMMVDKAKRGENSSYGLEFLF